ncbi:MAG TPA: branched-chain-amino-acid transaminase [Dissulfurispiraceae bacterium]|nr:branched-chain-amino-acid transaminase [Dissulfurispiraceae bacterium]
MKVYIDGEFYDRSEARISVFDHGLLYGDGVFEGIRIYGGKIFRLREHLDRLYDSAKSILLDIPMSKPDMEKAVSDTVQINERNEGYIRLIVTRGAGELGLDPGQCARPTVIIIAGDIQLYPPEYYDKGIAVVTASSRRMPSDSLDPRIKSLNYLNNVMAKIEAGQAGCLEAVMLNHEGYVSECTADNIFLVRSGKIATPAVNCGALGGITRSAVIELAGSLGIEVREAQLTRYDLYTADECFMTGTGAEIVPVVKIDGRGIGEGQPGPMTKRLAEEFRKLAGRQQ